MFFCRSSQNLHASPDQKFGTKMADFAKAQAARQRAKRAEGAFAAERRKSQAAALAAAAAALQAGLSPGESLDLRASRESRRSSAAYNIDGDSGANNGAEESEDKGDDDPEARMHRKQEQRALKEMLFEAIDMGDEDELLNLLDAGAKIDCTDKKGKTALMRAASDTHPHSNTVVRHRRRARAHRGPCA